MAAKSEETRRFYAEARCGEVDLGRCFCELTIDPHTPGEMSIVLHFDRPLSAKFHNSESKAIVVEGNNTVIELNEFPSWQMDGYGKSTVTAGVQEVQELRVFSDSEVSKAYIGYHFPLVALTESIPSMTNAHWKLGYIRGDLDDDGRIETPEPIRLAIDGKDFQITKRFDFYESGSLRYPEKLVVSQSLLEFNPDEVDDIDSTVDRSREMAEEILKLVSLVERDRIRWTTEMVTAKATGGAVVVTSSITRWASPPRARSGRFQYGHDYSGTLTSLVSSYDGLDHEKREDVMRAIGEFEIAHCAPTIESSLIYWHSVLDFLRGRLGYGGNPISIKLYELCKSRNIRLVDIASEETLEALSKGDRKARFPFTLMRNEFIHDGFDVFEGRYDEVIEARKQARALAERLLLSLMGMDHQNTLLGRVGD